MTTSASCEHCGAPCECDACLGGQTFILEEQATGSLPAKVEATVVQTPCGSLLVRIPGCADGEPVMIELWEGVIRVIVWDTENADPVAIIPIGKAKP